MKGRRAVRIAAALAGEAEACLLRAGCVPPLRADLAAAFWPHAVRLARAQKAEFRAAALHWDASAAAAGAEAVCTEVMAGLLAAHLREQLPARPAEIPWDLDPVAWAEQATREAA